MDCIESFGPVGDIFSFWKPSQGVSFLWLWFDSLSVIFGIEFFEIFGIKSGEELFIDFLVGEELECILILELVFVVFLFTKAFPFDFMFIMVFFLSDGYIFSGGDGPWLGLFSFFLAFGGYFDILVVVKKGELSIFGLVLFMCFEEDLQIHNSLSTLAQDLFLNEVIHRSVLIVLILLDHELHLTLRNVYQLLHPL